MMVEENHTMPSTTIRLSAPLLKMGAIFDRGEIHFAKEVHQPSTEHHDHDDEVPAAERVTNLIFKEQQKNNDRYAAQKDKHG